jgi:eukaryotic-like serine/threonine-protein kinase
MNPTLLAERYQVGELIATGGMGSVYRAMDTHLGRPVAVKVLKRVLADDATFLERFRREARAAAAISHPGVARVYDYGERSSEPFMVMELVDGDTLAQRIARLGRLPWEQAFAIAEQVASALSAAHAHGVIHRDVKPANILIDWSDRVKVTDFGIARAVRATSLTRPGMVLGSANYVAPEQAQGSPVGPAADLYSLGCVLFESVTGNTPYQGRNAVAIATQHVSSPVPDPRDRVPELPAAAAALIMRSLGKQPGDRFPDASTMASGLYAARAGRDPSAASENLTTTLPRVAPEPLAPPPPPTAAPGIGPEAGLGPATGPAPEAGPGHGYPSPPDPSAGTPPMPWAGVRAQRPKRRRGPWMLGLALGLVTLLALPFVVSMRSNDSDSPRTASSAVHAAGDGKGVTLSETQVRVPDLRGEPLEVATAKLRALDFVVDVRGDRGGRERRGVVVSMSPEQNSMVDRGGTVQLVVAKRTGKGGDPNEEDN